MNKNNSANFFDLLIGEKLSSVTFVMDYLQLDFDGNRLTFNIWPIVNVSNISYKYQQDGYRDKICSLITDIVSSIDIEIGSYLILEFSNGDSISISLNIENPDLVTPEILTFTDRGNSLHIL